MPLQHLKGRLIEGKGALPKQRLFAGQHTMGEGNQLSTPVLPAAISKQLVAMRFLPALKGRLETCEEKGMSDILEMVSASSLPCA